MQAHEPIPSRRENRRESDSFPTKFVAADSLGQKILWGVCEPMGNNLDTWTCPLCNSALNLREYPSRRGFVLVCKGTDAVPHRMRIYLEGFRKDAPFLPAPKVTPVEMPRVSRTKELLSRAARLAEEKEVA